MSCGMSDPDLRAGKSHAVFDAYGTLFDVHSAVHRSALPLPPPASSAGWPSARSSTLPRLRRPPARRVYVEEEPVYVAPPPRRGPICHYERRKVWLDEVEFTYRRVEVCE